MSTLLLVVVSSAMFIFHQVMFVSNVCKSNVISPKVQNQCFLIMPCNLPSLTVFQTIFHQNRI